MTVRLLSTANGDTYWGAEGGRGAGRRLDFFFFLMVLFGRPVNASSTFAECGDAGPVGGGAAHVVEAGGPQLIGRVRLEACTHNFLFFFNFIIIFFIFFLYLTHINIPYVNVMSLLCLNYCWVNQGEVILNATSPAHFSNLSLYCHI